MYHTTYHKFKYSIIYTNIHTKYYIIILIRNTYGIRITLQLIHFYLNLIELELELYLYIMLHAILST